MTYLCPRCHRPLTEQSAQRIGCASCGLQLELPADDTRPGVAPAASANVLGLGLAVDHSGQTVGRFQLHSCLGAGGMGTVYRATDTASGQTVAVKVLYPYLALQPELVARFQREAELLCQLDHPAVVRGIGPGHAGGLHFLAMEFVDGDTLEARLAGGRIAADEVRRIALQIAAALGAAHDRGIVHRDLKPANVMLTAGGVKVLDFGIAGTAFSEQTLTQSHAVIGTFNYMAPEQRQGGLRVDGRADLFALGVILYRMLTGELPIGSYAPPSDLVRGLGRRWDRLIARALQPAPERRYQSAAALAADLTALEKSRRIATRGALAALLVAGAAFATALGVHRWIAAALPAVDAGGVAAEDALARPVEDAGALDAAGAADATLPDAARPDLELAPGPVLKGKDDFRAIKSKLAPPPEGSEPEEKKASPKLSPKKKYSKKPGKAAPLPIDGGTP